MSMSNMPMSDESGLHDLVIAAAANLAERLQMAELAEVPAPELAHMLGQVARGMRDLAAARAALRGPSDPAVAAAAKEPPEIELRLETLEEWNARHAPKLPTSE